MLVGAMARADGIDPHFLGAFEALYQAMPGENPPTLEVRIRCDSRAGCVVLFGRSAEHFDVIRPYPDRQIFQARFALNYARERRARALDARPDLAPLLHSDAQIESCVDLNRSEDRMQQPPEYPGGYILLCKLDRNPWPKRTVLLMGTLLGSCGPAFCRFEIVPLFRD